MTVKIRPKSHTAFMWFINNKHELVVDDSPSKVVSNQKGVVEFENGMECTSDNFDDSWVPVNDWHLRKIKTLLQILVDQLPALGGWPEGVEWYSQLDDGCAYLKFNGAIPHHLIGGRLQLASDQASAIVTKEQYEAALNR
ncbi:hypothetical protein AB8Q18_08645 [Neisseriaceae bacterium CLB008]